MAEPDLSLVLQVSRDTLAEVRRMRTELREVRHVALLNVELTRRVDRRVGEVERRIDELKDDVETIVKVEVGGRLAHVETRLEEYVQRTLEDELAARDEHGMGGVKS